MTQLEEQKDRLQAELEKTKKDRDEQLKKKSKEIDNIKREKETRTRERDNIWKNFEDEKRKQQDLQADLTKKEIARLDLDQVLKKTQQSLAEEEAKVANIRAERDEINEKYIGQIDQIAAFQNKCIEKDSKIKRLEEDIAKSKPQTPEKKRKLIRNRDISTEGEFSTPLNNGGHRREDPIQTSQGVRHKIKPTQKSSG